MLSYTTNAKQFMNDIDRKIRIASYAGLSDTAKEMKIAMMALTSGPYSSAVLALAGHPFARRRFGMRVSPSTGKILTRRISGINISTTPINIQTGNLQASYFDYFSRSGQMEMMWSFGFRIPYASYVLAEYGTRSMIQRLFWDRLTSIMKPVFKNRMEAAFKQVFQ